MKETYELISAEMIGLFYKGFNEEEIDKFERYLRCIFDNLDRYENNII